MNVTTAFAAGLVAAAANATEAIELASSIHKLNAPRVTLRGPYYTSRPYFAPSQSLYPASDTDHVSTDDDRYSSSDSDSLSSSDEHLSSEEKSECARNGDPYACLRVQQQADCNVLQTLNEKSCMCEENYTCSTLKDFYGRSKCAQYNYG